MENTTNKEQVLGNAIADTFANSKNKMFREAGLKAKGKGLSAGEVLNMVSDETGTPLNDLVGNTAILIGEQWIDKQGADLYGDIFKLKGDFDTGGVYITLRT